LSICGKNNDDNRVYKRGTKKVKIDHSDLYFSNLSNIEFKEQLQKPGVIDELVFIMFPPIAEENSQQRHGKISNYVLKQRLA